MSKQIGILGYGEVGQAIAKFYGSAGSPQAKIKDLNRDDGLKGVEILHVCVPFNKKFIEVVSKEIKSIKPKLTIVHSTVAPGTTKKLIAKTGNKMIVHSPIRGMHPHLYSGIKTFVKFIGAENKKAGEMAKKFADVLNQISK